MPDWAVGALVAALSLAMGVLTVLLARSRSALRDLERTTRAIDARTPRPLTVVAALTAVVALLVTIGSAQTMVQSDPEERVRRAALDSEGSLQLTFLGAPEGFEALTTVSFLDIAYHDGIRGTLFEAASPMNFDQVRSGDLSIVVVRTEITASVDETPDATWAPTPWTLATSGSGRLMKAAHIYDSSKAVVTCPDTGFGRGVIADNAVAIDATGPDPKEYSLGAVRDRVEQAERNAPVVELPLDQELYDNSEITSDEVIFASMACAERRPPLTPSEEADTDCEEDDAAIRLEGTVTSGVEAEIAEALGTSPPSYATWACVAGVSYQSGVAGDLHFGSVLARSPVMYVDGAFAVRLPTVSVRAVTETNEIRELPVRVEIVDRMLMGVTEDEIRSPDVEPESPNITAEAASALRYVSPNAVLDCEQTRTGENVCQDPAGQLRFASTGEPLDVYIEGDYPLDRKRAESAARQAPIVFGISLGVLVPLIGFLINRALSRRNRAMPPAEAA